MAVKTVKKKEPVALSPEDKFYRQYSQMAKVNFLGFVLKDFFRERMIGKDFDSIEAARIRAILRLLDEKFTDQVE